jgi:small basic protein (TIGR04137 family)
MSIHPSLRGVDNLVGERSVFTRKERIQILMKAGKFDAASGSVHGLPKVRTRFKTVGKKKAAPEAKSEGGAAAAEAKPE